MRAPHVPFIICESHHHVVTHLYLRYTRCGLRSPRLPASCSLPCTEQCSLLSTRDYSQAQNRCTFPSCSPLSLPQYHSVKSIFLVKIGGSLRIGCSFISNTLDILLEAKNPFGGWGVREKDSLEQNQCILGFGGFFFPTVFHSIII